jgi:hypothetical protein
LFRKAGPSGADLSKCAFSIGGGDSSALLLSMSVLVFNPYNNRVTITQLGWDSSSGTGGYTTLPPGELVRGVNYLVSNDLWPALFSFNCTTPSNANGACAVSINDDTPDGTAQYWYSISVTGLDVRYQGADEASVGVIIGIVVAIILLGTAAGIARDYICGLARDSLERLISSSSQKSSGRGGNLFGGGALQRGVPQVPDDASVVVSSVIARSSYPIAPPPQHFVQQQASANAAQPTPPSSLTAAWRN